MFVTYCNSYTTVNIIIRVVNEVELLAIDFEIAIGDKDIRSGVEMNL